MQVSTHSIVIHTIFDDAQCRSIHYSTCRSFEKRDFYLYWGNAYAYVHLVMNNIAKTLWGKQQAKCLHPLRKYKAHRKTSCSLSELWFAVLGAESCGAECRFQDFFVWCAWKYDSNASYSTHYFALVQHIGFYNVQ